MYARAAMIVATKACKIIPAHWWVVDSAICAQLPAMGVMNAARQYKTRRAVDCFGVIALWWEDYAHSGEAHGAFMSCQEWRMILDDQDAIMEVRTVHFTLFDVPLLALSVDPS